MELAVEMMDLGIGAKQSHLKVKNQRNVISHKLMAHLELQMQVNEWVVQTNLSVEAAQVELTVEDSAKTATKSSNGSPS